MVVVGKLTIMSNTITVSSPKRDRCYALHVINAKRVPDVDGRPVDCVGTADWNPDGKKIMKR